MVMTPDIDKLKALVEAGEKATQGEWSDGYEHLDIQARYEHAGIYYQMKVLDIRGWGHLTGMGARGLDYDDAKNIQVANCEFITQAANCRQDIAALIEQNERYEKALKFISENVVFEDAEATSIDYHETLELHQRKTQQALKESE